MKNNKCNICNTVVIKPVIDTKQKVKSGRGTEEIYSERCPTCSNLLYGYSKELKTIKPEVNL